MSDVYGKKHWFEIAGETLTNIKHFSSGVSFLVPRCVIQVLMP